MTSLDPAIAARLKRTRRRPGAGGRAAARHRRGADARLDGRRGAGPDADAPAGRRTGAAAGRSTGSRARPPATASGSRRSGSTATATPCWSRSTRRARPATPATAPASTPTCCWPAPWLTRRPMAERAGRTFGPVVLLGLAARPGSRPSPATKPGRGSTGPRPGLGMTLSRSLAASAVDAAAAGALALVVLAAWGVLLVTRGRVRRAVAVLGAAGRRSGCSSPSSSAGPRPPDSLRATCADPRCGTDVGRRTPAGSGRRPSGRCCRWSPPCSPSAGAGLARDGQPVRRARAGRPAPVADPRSSRASTCGGPWTRAATPPPDRLNRLCPARPHHDQPTRSPACLTTTATPRSLDRRRGGAARLRGGRHRADVRPGQHAVFWVGVALGVGSLWSSP